MRRTVIGAASALTLAVTALPGFAAAATRVDGDHLQAAGLRLAVRDCVDPGKAPGKRPAFRATRNKPSVGRASVGWIPSGTGFGAGPTGFLAKPSELRTMAIRVRSTAAQSQGVGTITYQPPEDDGYWVGTTDLITDLNQDDKPDWRTIDAADRAFSWRHYTKDGVEDGTSFALDIPSFVALRGGDGEGAYLGFAFGCDGNRFDLDRLQLQADGAAKVYDFEAIRTRATLQRGTSQDRTVRVVYGAKVNLVGKVRESLGGKGVAGVVKISAKGPGDKKFRKVVKKRVGVGGAVRKTVRPSKNTVYRISFPGSTKHEPSRSTLKVLVAPNVTGSLAKRTVVQGSRLSMRGRSLPARRAAIRLQKYTGGKWRTVTRGATARNGRYAISAPASRTGRSFWRVWVAGGAGNTWGASVSRKLVTVAPPSTGGGGGGGGNGGGGNGGGGNPPPTDPPPPPPTEPPPPPPPGS
ncbi:hypothetical protein AB0N29_13005 [Nocardioides sp. NPDC092400]|uniref:hypothetical protein n=1 Tax=Nocardioides sp. NPDC092400 TaxID=3155196 RepID=UPI003439BB85